MSNSKISFSGDTSILMRDGTSKNIDELEINDKIMSPDGKLVTISEIIKKHKDMYYVYPVRGSPYSISEDSLISLKASMAPGISWASHGNYYIVAWLEKFKYVTKSFLTNTYGTKKKAFKAAKNYLKNEIPNNEKCTNYGDIVTTSVGDYVDIPEKIKRLYKVFSSGIEFKGKKVDVDPYILGYWLGDGSSRDTVITTAEPEIVEYFENFAEDNGLLFKKQGKSKYNYAVTSGINGGPIGRNSFMNFLKKNNLIYNKHIPDDYQFNSREKRLKLLAGLIDSDGYYIHGCYDFIFKSETLADDTIFLARSLGFKAYKKQVQKTCTNSARGRVTGTYYRFYISGEGLDEIPSILERKQATKRTQIKNASVSGFVVFYEGKEECYQLKTKSKASLLLDDFTVVHV